MEQQKAAGVPRQNLLHGALILLVAIALVKVIGALYKIPLGWILTPVGFADFNNAYSLYTVMYSLATAGFPVAISRMVSESYARGRYRDIGQIHRSAVRIFFTLGVAAFILMILLARPYVYFALESGGSDVLPAIYALSPAVFFISMMSIYRGYYEGLRNMYPTAISEVMVALCKLIFGLAAAFIIKQIGMDQFANTGMVFGTAVDSASSAELATLPFAAAGAIFGISLGNLLGFIFLHFYFKIHGEGLSHDLLMQSPRPYTLKVTTSRLIRTALPIAAGSVVVNLSSLIDAAFLQNRLTAIMDQHGSALIAMYQGILPADVIAEGKVPHFLYGCYSYAVVLFMLVPSITQAFGVSALPNVTEAWTYGNKKNLRHSIESVLRVVAVVAFPLGLGLSVMATPIASLIYNASSAPSIVGRVLTLLGIAAIFCGISSPVYSMLQSVGRVDLPVKLMMVGLTIKIVLNYTLAGIPTINIYGAGVGTLACYTFIVFSALYFLRRSAKVQIHYFSIYVKPFLSAACCALSALLVQVASSAVLPSRLATCLGIAVGGVVYIICLLIFRTLDAKDIQMLPKGQKIVKILEKHNWIR